MLRFLPPSLIRRWDQGLEHMSAWPWCFQLPLLSTGIFVEILAGFLKLCCSIFVGSCISLKLLIFNFEELISFLEIVSDDHVLEVVSELLNHHTMLVTIVFEVVVLLLESFPLLLEVLQSPDSHPQSHNIVSQPVEIGRE